MTLRRATRNSDTYLIVDLLHQGRIARVAGHQIATTVDTWLSELGIRTTLSQELARAACAGDWASAHALADDLSVAVSAEA